jgi:hypothetical protein
MFLPRVLGGALLAAALAAPAAHADVVATTARPTLLAAGGGKLLYSEWDGKRYRLTELGVGALGVRGSAKPFLADIGRDAAGREVAVYPRDGVLYRYDFHTRRERRLVAGTAGSISGDRLLFARKNAIYARTLRPGGKTRVLTPQRALSVDAHGAEVAFSASRRWSNQPWLADFASANLLARVPGGGASSDFLDALNPTVSGNAVYWLLARQGDHDFGEIHRYNRAEQRDERVNLRIDGIVTGFAYDRGTAYYSVGTEIHHVSGLRFEPAPRIRMAP